MSCKPLRQIQRVELAVDPGRMAAFKTKITTCAPGHTGIYPMKSTGLLTVANRSKHLCLGKESPYKLGQQNGMLAHLSSTAERIRSTIDMRGAIASEFRQA